ncbi:polyketide cyclase [Mycobacterium sp. 852002-51613_SCH5001154]|uniref:SRPBCC family protein n=1 Tax=Mycobacterium sp. 852002-51613_SCH5001154 TaxID=1834104 RepID=UPI00080137F2|nr:SRPBCC family protein [Mycobacterium sp. 852002-51613_SCH5001154]OBF70540.1 polyketide cyclase [Mycobacterium sp. 852002-51613_SCH5001154]
MPTPMMLTTDRAIAAPPSAVWDLLVDLDAWPKWGPTIRGASLDEPYTELGLHATGTVDTSLLITVPFVVTEFEPGRLWAWKVAGIPATRHWVDPMGEGARAGMGVPWWAAPYVSVCAIALRRIDALLTDER